MSKFVPLVPIKILVTGPECAGKTTLAVDLHHHLAGSVLINEVARSYLQREEIYTEEDVLHIAELQLAQRQEAIVGNCPIVICDTDLIVISIWLSEKFHSTSKWIEDELKVLPFDIVFLCSPNIPWEADGLRENPDDRDQLLALYYRKIQELNIESVFLTGSRENRLQTALSSVEVCKRSQQ